MAEKKALMTADTKEFIAAMNPKKECKRKSNPRQRSVKAHHSQPQN